MKLIGQHTFGALDYSNKELDDLPSGMPAALVRDDAIAENSRSDVGCGGIPPDIYLPTEPASDAKQEEVRRVQSWLEGGSLAPRAAK